MTDRHDQFDALEREMRESLAARPAPEGFAEKVLARVEDQEARRGFHLVLFPRWRGALAAALIAAAFISAGLWQRQRQQRMAGERARDQAVFALRVAGSTLNTVLQQAIQHPVKEDQP